MNLFFRKLGSGSQKIVILHGLYGSSDNWMTIGRKLSDTKEVFLIDLRNHGHSFHDPEHSYKAMAEDVINLLHKEITGQICLMGHSMGGKTAMLIAALCPEKIEKLIIADIAPKDYRLMSEDQSQFSFHKNLLNQMNLIDFKDCKSLKDVGEKILQFAPDPALCHFLMKDVAKTALGYQWKINVPVLLQSIDEIIGGPRYKVLQNKNGQKFTFPVLLIRGANSPYVNTSDLPLFTNLYNDFSIKTISNAGHWLHAEQPNIFLENVSCFLNK